MELGRLLVLGGLVLSLIGLAVMGVTKLGLPLGRLPGDFISRGKNTTVYFPLVTCLLLSLLGTLVMWLLRRR